MQVIINKSLVQTRVLYFFLIYMLFINSITNRLSVIISYVVVALFLVLLFIFRGQEKIHIKYLIYGIFMVFVLVISHMYQQMIYEHNNIYFIQFFGAQILFFLLFAFFVNIKIFIEKYLKFFLISAIFLIFLFVMIDFILLEMNMGTYQLMYREYANSYRLKPLGLFGQFSVTSTYVVFFYLIYLSLEKVTINVTNIVLFIFLTIVVLLQNSGTGYIVYIFMISTLLYHFHIFKIVLLPFVFGITISIIFSGVVDKISIGYIIYLIDEHAIVLIQDYLTNLNSILDLLFGMAYGDIDFGPTFLMTNIGMLYFILYSIVLLYMIWKNNNIYFRVAIMSLMFGNLHYPVLFYPLMNIFLPILLLFVVKVKSIAKEKNEASS